ncbi:plasmid mobilization relaxosome protein MobC [Lactococcus garvieae]|nr:plasmid mobilization relaxosome protein MobC [Lactococcus garvieae]
MENKYKLKRPYERKVRFSKEENEYLKKKIEDGPFNNFQNYARILCLTGEVKVVDYSKLLELNNEVRRMGNNINQMAKLAHQFEEIAPEDIQDLTDLILEVKNLISNKLAKEIKTERII